VVNFFHYATWKPMLALAVIKLPEGPGCSDELEFGEFARPV